MCIYCLDVHAYRIDEFMHIFLLSPFPFTTSPSLSALPLIPGFEDPVEDLIAKTKKWASTISTYKFKGTTLLTSPLLSLHCSSLILSSHFMVPILSSPLTSLFLSSPLLSLHCS